MNTPDDAYRALLFHKQSTSARTLFLKHGDGSICAFGAFPEPAELLDQTDAGVVPHPTLIVHDAAQRLGLSKDALELEPEFSAEVSYGSRQAPVYLLRMTAMDPPHELAEARGGRFIAITEARQLPVVELELLRRAYEAILG